MEVNPIACASYGEVSDGLGKIERGPARRPGAGAADSSYNRERQTAEKS
jgi:hypothetical protein